MSDMLVSQEKYLEAGIHIGTKLKTSDMVPFIYKARHDKLYVLDLKQVDDRIRLAAKFLARFEPADVLVVASRTYAGNATSVFSKLTGVKQWAGRFVPGMFTNPQRDNFLEPKLLFVCDPKGERQAIFEAATSGIPVVALADTDNTTKYVDWIIPCNNKGRKSLALIFYLLAREIQKEKGQIKTDEEFQGNLEEFEEGLEQPEPEPEPVPQQPPKTEEPAPVQVVEKAKRQKKHASETQSEPSSPPAAEETQEKPAKKEKPEKKKKADNEG